MRAVVTRVNEASVTIDGQVTGQIGKGFLILLGITHDDTPVTCKKLAEKVLGLRIFTDENYKMNMEYITTVLYSENRRSNLTPEQNSLHNIERILAYTKKHNYAQITHLMRQILPLHQQKKVAMKN